MPVTINSLKYDLSIRRSWQAELIEQSGDLLVLAGVFDRDVDHPELGLIPSGTVSQEYYWLDRWYNIFRFLTPKGNLRNYYCNVNMPPCFLDNVLDYVDLDIDVLVWPDASHAVLDMDEFEENAAQFSYPADVRTKALASLNELIDLKERKIFPFD